MFFLWAATFSIAAALVAAPGSEPDADLVLTTLLWLVPVIVIMFIPGTFASLWGPNYLSSGLAGLLFKSEIVLGAVSATLLSSEPFGWREFTGVLLIAGASLVETLLATFSVRRRVVMTVECGGANFDAGGD